MEAWRRAGMRMARTPLVQTIAAPIEFASAVTCYRDAHNGERPASTMRATARASFPLPYSRTPYFPAFRFCATDFSLARATSGAKPCDIWKGSRWPARDEPRRVRRTLKTIGPLISIKPDYEPSA